MTTQLDVDSRADEVGVVRRQFDLQDFQFRDTEDGTGFTFEGIAASVDVGYIVRDKFGEYTEIIRAGAFDKSVKERGQYRSASQKDDVGLYVNHGWKWGQIPLASRNAGTLQLGADPHLRAKADLDPARPDVLIVRSAVTRGELPQMSVGFDPIKTRDKWNKDYTEVVRGEVRLKEVSIVDVGCNEITSTSMRSFDEFMDSLTDIEMSDDEIRRAFEYFQTRMPAPDNPFAERDAEDRARLERLRLNRPALLI